MKNIKKPLILLAATALPLFLTSCFQNETTIHLNKDGSGTLVEETHLGARMLEMMGQAASRFGGGDEKKAKEDFVKSMFSEEKARTRAGELGEGVSFEKSEPLNVDGDNGARVTYRFKDINKLRVVAGGGMKNLSSAGGPPIPAKKNDPITFNYSAGKLAVHMPEQKKPEGGDKPTVKVDMGGPEDQEKMKQMLGDMKMSLKLVVDSGIAGTDASHKDGNTITLMEMKMGRLVENNDNLKKFVNANQDDPIAAAKMFKDIEGIKVETKKDVSVTLK